MGKKHGPNKENLEATRRIFLNIARKEFASSGYYNASTAKIVEESGMARGSLYYHFGDKKGLFRAIYEEVMIEMQQAIQKKVNETTTSWDALIMGCLTCLDLCTSPETRRIVIDVHTALSYGERVEVLQKTLLSELQKHMTGAQQQGHFKGMDSRSLGIIIFGIISEGGRSFELVEDIAKAREDLGRTFVSFMETARG